MVSFNMRKNKKIKINSKLKTEDNRAALRASQIRFSVLLSLLCCRHESEQNDKKKRRKK